MKILLLTHYYEPELGAPQRRWSGLVQRWQEAGHEVTVYCPPPHYPDHRSSASRRHSGNRPGRTERGNYGETIRRMPYLLHGYSGALRFLDQLVTAGSSCLLAPLLERQQSFDLVISTVPGMPSAVAGHLLARRFGIPHVLEVRDAWPDILIGEAKDLSDFSPVQKIRARADALAAQSLAGLVRYTQKHADSVVTTTYAFADILKERGYRKVKTISNGVDTRGLARDVPPLEKDPQRKHLRLQYLGTVGRSQGLKVLIRALRDLKARGQEDLVEARILGEGADLPYLKNYAEKYGVTIDFLPPANKSELAQIYAWADINLVCLRRAKVFEWTVPSKIFELIATRRKIIGLLEGEAAQLIEKTKSGIVLAPGDHRGLAACLEELALNPDSRQQDPAALDLLEAYNYDTLAQQYLQLLEDVLPSSQEPDKR